MEACGSKSTLSGPLGRLGPMGVPWDLWLPLGSFKFIRQTSKREYPLTVGEEGKQVDCSTSAVKRLSDSRGRAAAQGLGSPPESVGPRVAS